MLACYVLGPPGDANIQLGLRATGAHSSESCVCPYCTFKGWSIPAHTAPLLYWVVFHSMSSFRLVIPSGSTLWLSQIAWQQTSVLDGIQSAPCPLLWGLTSMDSIIRDACTLWLPGGGALADSQEKERAKVFTPLSPFLRGRLHLAESLD